MREFLKKIIKIWPWPLTRNEKYDRQTEAIIKKVCTPDSICIDIGCFNGEILSLMQEVAPQGHHIAFEPIPSQFEKLKRNFGAHADIYPFALGDDDTTTTFNHVVSNPTYSGLQKRTYKGHEEIQEIKVDVKRLDQVIKAETPIRLIKIDVEGGEFDVLKGAIETLRHWKPYLIFEHGIGGADKYGVSPGEVYRLLVRELGYRICLMGDFLKNEQEKGFTSTQFEEQFWKAKNCYFLAVP